MDIIQDRIEKEMEDFIASGIIQLVDWREIIYQMAIDYRANYYTKELNVEF